MPRRKKLKLEEPVKTMGTDILPETQPVNVAFSLVEMARKARAVTVVKDSHLQAAGLRNVISKIEGEGGE